MVITGTLHLTLDKTLYSSKIDEDASAYHEPQPDASIRILWLPFKTLPELSC